MKKNNYIAGAREFDKAFRAFVIKVIATTVVFMAGECLLFVYDLSLFDPVFTRASHNSSEIHVMLQVIAAALAPLASAALAAYYLRKCLYRESRLVFAIVMTALFFTLTAACLYGGWTLRDSHYGADNSEVGSMVNLCAVVAAFASFALTFIHSWLHERFKTQADAKKAARDSLSLLGQFKEFGNTFLRDRDRRLAEDRYYKSSLIEAVLKGVSVAGACRNEIAAKVASNPAEYELIISTPIRIGNKFVQKETDSETHSEIMKLLDMPSDKDMIGDWPAHVNSEFSDRSIQERAAKYEKHIESILEGDTSYVETVHAIKTESENTSYGHHSDERGSYV